MYTSTFTFLLIASQALTILAIPAPISPTTGLRLVLSRQAAEAGINATAEAARIEDLATKFESLRASLETAEGNPNLTAAETAARIETLKTAISNGETGKGLGAQANAAQLKDGDNLLKVKDNIGAILQAGAETDAERKAEIAAAGAAANGTASGEAIASNSTSNGTAGTEGAATVASENTGASSKDKLIASLEDALAAAKAS